MAFTEYAHSFGTVTAANAAQFSIEETFKGNASFPRTARILYAIIRNSTGGAVTVTGTRTNTTVGIGERKRIEFPINSRFFTVIPAASVTAGDLTADIGIEGVTI